MRALFAALLAFVATPALADWDYVPPPIGAFVAYDDGHDSRVVAVEGYWILLLDQDGGRTVTQEFRSWLLRERNSRPSLDTDLSIEVEDSEEVLALWPLQDGESIEFDYETFENGELAGDGEMELTYLGEENLQVRAGNFLTYKLQRDATMRRNDNGQVQHTVVITWHEAGTGLILRQDWRVELPGVPAQSGSYQAVSVELP